MTGGDALQLALGAARLVSYAGFVLLGGTLAFWVLVWPDGQRERRLALLAIAGSGLSVLGALAAPAIMWAAAPDGTGPLQAIPRLVGAAALARLAVLAAAAGWFTDLTAGPILDRRRAAAAGIVVALSGTFAAQSDALTGRWALLTTAATMGHLLAAAAWLGGLLALAAVIIPREQLDRLDELIPRFSRVAFASVVMLVATGTVHALAVAGGPSNLAASRYGLALLLKTAAFAAMLALGNYGRRYANRAVLRRIRTGQTAQPPDAETGGEAFDTPGGSTLAVVMGAELATAFAVLALTAALVWAGPGP